MDKENGSINGAECANTSNLTNHEKRIRAIHDILRKSGAPIAPMLLNDNPAEKPTAKQNKEREDEVRIQFEIENRRFTAASRDPFQHIGDMSLKQVCPYMEFLLRYADKTRVGGSRWFLSIVDSARAGVKMT